MPIFMYQFKYTPSAWAGFIKKPEDRGAVVDELLKGIGGRLISIYYTTRVGRIGCPDANVAMAVLMAILAPDHLMETQTCMLYTMKDMIKALETAKALKFRGIAGELPSETWS